MIQEQLPSLNNTPGTPESAVRNLHFKAVLLLISLLFIIVLSVFYIMYARGTFDQTQELVLLADDSEGIKPGMDLTFSGFPVGRVRNVALADNGSVRIYIDIPNKDAKWLRTTSVFTIENSLVGTTKIRAYSGVLTDPQLAPKAERTVLKGDASSELPKLVASMKDLSDNLVRMTSDDSALNNTIGNAEQLTLALKNPKGALKTLLGEDANQISLALKQTNAILAQAQKLTQKTDQKVFGETGLISDSQKTVKNLNATLEDTRNSLKKMDAILADTKIITANTKDATQDLIILRQEVDANLRKIDSLVNDINRKWPFARDTEIKLP
jgi:phospholipid/cholesterol/gamma-HCH transport system substrate-binding protein